MKFGSWTFNGDQVVLDWYEGQEKVALRLADFKTNMKTFKL